MDYDPAALDWNPGLTWIGHSTFFVRMDGVSFLTDPMFSERASPLRFAGPARLVAPGVPLDRLPTPDFALVSHDHYDHCDLPTVRALAARGVPFLVPNGLGLLLRGVGADVTELGWWDSVAAGDGAVRVHCVPAQHFSGRGLRDTGRRLWSGWVVEGRTRRFYHAGDTGGFAGFAEIGRRLGPIDVAAMPIGAYRPPEIMQPVHLNPEEAVRAALDAGARTVAAMHWGTFDLTDEPLDEPPARFLACAARHGLGPERAWVFTIGETRAF